MLLELLSLLFYFYYWMTWLQGDGLMPSMDEIKKLLGQGDE